MRWALVISFMLVATPVSNAQLFRGRRAPPESAAIVGEPFGVGRVSIRLPDARAGFFGERDFTLREANGRAFYATFDFQPVRAILREVLNRPQDVTVRFLFTGNAPLDLELFVPDPVRLRVVPARDPLAHGQVLDEWWRQYTEAARRSAGTDEYPQFVDSYLLSMLAERLSLPPPNIERSLFPQADIDTSLGVLLGMESTRLKTQERVMLRSPAAGSADEPLPKPPSPPELVAPEVKDAKVEDIAEHVPEEWFYIRFGNFPNYLWFSRLLTEYGGELRNLVAMRGVDYRLNSRQEKHLVFK
jgi:hypothetical protein